MASMSWGLSGPTDEELAKKDDDVLLPRSSRPWQPINSPRRPSRQRYIVYAAFVVALIFLVRAFTISSEDIVRPYSSSERYFPDYPDRFEGLRKAILEPPEVQPEQEPGGKALPKEEPHHAVKYNGPVKFPALGASLRTIGPTGGAYSKNRNVLFAAANLKSVANLLPLACDMAFERENFVHFAFMSQSEIPLKDLLAINGVGKHCSIIVHDARLDSSAASTESRLALGTARAMYHINTYMHPQAVLVDGTNTEDNFFLRGMRDELRTKKFTLIELPAEASTRLSWLRKLDTLALAAWNSVHFDVLVQAPLTGAGNMRRLLRSLSHADLSGVSAPHITIELPPKIDQALEQTLASFNWPPRSGNVPQNYMVSLRHRIPLVRLTEEERSVRFLESFWPSNPSQHHVLVLSPHTEITPQFFQYVKYELLYRRFSATGATQDVKNQMLGLGFASPTTFLHNDKAFVPPSHQDNAASGSFIWEAPSSDAMLILGDKWLELHGYVSQVLAKQEEASRKLQKQVTKKHPSWLEHLLQLSRLRGYFTLYPGKDTSNVILGVHSDLLDAPEEFEGQRQDRPRPSEEFSDKASDDGFDVTTQLDMMATLPRDGTLADLNSMPVLTWDGKVSTLENMRQTAAQFAKEFRRSVGGCTDDATPVADKYAKDMFCSK